MPHREALVLLPGMFGDADLWSEQIAELQQGTDVLPLELRGDSVGDYAEYVLSLAPARFNLAGLSLGGHVAFEIMRRAPHRVLRLALLNTTARPEPAEKMKARQTLSQLMESGRFAEVVEQLLPLAIHTGPGSDPALLEEARKMAFRCGPEKLSARNRAMMTRPDSRPTLRTIACPTLIVAGRQDRPVTPAETEELVAGIPHARLILIEACGHLSSLEHPTVVTRALGEWLQQPAINN